MSFRSATASRDDRDGVVLDRYSARPSVSPWFRRRASMNARHETSNRQSQHDRARRRGCARRGRIRRLDYSCQSGQWADLHRRLF
jgi:hypothetical protein